MSTPNTSNTPSASECPACGAPLHLNNIPADQMQLKCDYCGTLVNIPGREKPVIHQTVVNINTDDYMPMTTTVTKVSGVVRLITILVPLVIVVATLGSIFSAFGGVFNFLGGANVSPQSVIDIPKQLITQSEFGNNAFNNPLLVPAGDGQPPEMISVMRDASDSQYYLIDTLIKDKKIKWKGAQMGKEYYNVTMRAGAGQLFAGDADKLAAYKTDTGAAAWQVSLASAPPLNCPTCQQVLGSSVVSFGRDGTLQGFNTSDGKPLWSKRLDPFNGKPLDAPEHLVVADAISQTKPSLGVALLVLDPATGETKQRIEATCAAGNAKIPSRLQDRVYFTPKGDGMFVLYAGSDMSGNGAGCLQRYDLNTGKLLWSTLFKAGEGFPFSIASWVSVLPTSDALFILDDGNAAGSPLLVIDPQTGKARKFVLDAQYRFTLKDASADMLIVEAHPKFDSTRNEYWGVGVEDGARKWQFTMDKAMRIDSSAIKMTKQGFVILQCGNNPDKQSDTRCAFDRLDTKTGVSGGQMKVDVSGTPLGMHPRITEDGVFIINYNKLIGLSLTDGKTIYELP